MSDEDELSLGSDTVASSVHANDDDELDSSESESEESEDDESDGTDNSDSVSDEESYDDDDDDDTEENRAHEFVDFIMRFHDDVTLQVLKERAELLPAEIIRDEVLEYNVLHHYVGYSAECHPAGGHRQEGWPAANIDLEVVKFLLELAPDVVHKAEDGGGHPLHIACLNADCPESVVEFLLEKNPSSASWDEEGCGLPLNCYLRRACRHTATGHHDDDGEWEEEFPALPSGKLDYRIVKMLVEAYPDALTHRLPHKRGTPLNTLCRGYDVSMELVHLLMDKDGLCLENDDGEKTDFGHRRDSPLWNLLYNSLADPFPTDVFRYLLERDSSAFKISAKSDDVDNNTNEAWHNGIGTYTPLNLACSNKNMSAETIELIIRAFPEMVREKYKYDGLLPLHTLCKNNELGEQSAIDILKLLISAFPESVKKRVDGGRPSWFVGSDRGKLPIHIAEENDMSLGFCKAFLSERARLSSGMTNANILQMACLECSLEMIKKLVEDDRGLLLQKDGDGHIALHTAVKYSSLECVKYLVGEDDSALMVPDDAMELPLHKACRKANYEMSEYLLNKNMEAASAKNIFDELPLRVFNQSVKSMMQLRSVEHRALALNFLMAYLEAVPRGNIVQVACLCKCSLAVIKPLVNMNTDLLRKKDESGCIPLHTAARNSSLGVVKYLVRKNKSTITEKDNDGQIPLHLAAEISSVEVVKYLVDRNEKTLVERDEVMELPLHKACRTGNCKVVDFLVEKNMATVSAKNLHDELPLHILCDETGKKEGQLQSVEYTDTVFKLLLAYPETVNV